MLYFMNVKKEEKEKKKQQMSLIFSHFLPAKGSEQSVEWGFNSFTLISFYLLLEVWNLNQNRLSKGFQFDKQIHHWVKMLSNKLCS